MEAEKTFMQLDLFKMFDDLFGSDSQEESHIEQVVKHREDYLQKGNRLEDLAKEDFARRLRKIDVTKAEEAVCHVKFKEGDNLSEMMRKIARHAIRPILRNMEQPEDLEELLRMIDKRFNVSVTIPDVPVCSIDYVISNSKKREPGEKMLLLTLKEPDYPDLFIWGTKIACHPANRKNALFRNGYAVCDIAEVLALLIIISKVLAAQDNTSFLREQTLLVESYKQCTSCLPLEEKRFVQYDSTSRKVPKLVADALTSQGVHIETYPAKSEVLRKLLSKRLPDVYVLNRSNSALLMPILWDSIKDRFHYHDLLHCTENGDYWPSVSSSYFSIYSSKSIYSFLGELFLIVQANQLEQLQILNDYKELSSGYAKSYQKKKHIPENTLKAMEDSALNKYFGFVEFDELVDIQKILEITNEFIAVKETYLPFVDSSNDAIRFRRLGNHKAAGLYYPHVRCLCVDIHNPYSFIHEYGHLIDYQYGSLSQKDDFDVIRCMYKSCMEEITNPAVKNQLDGNTKYNMTYYLKPTEIFARCFELYMSKSKGVVNSLLPKSFGFEYPSDKKFLTEVEKYFDRLFQRLYAGLSAA